MDLNGTIKSIPNVPQSIREGAPSNHRTDNFAGKSSTRLVISLHSIHRKG
jgi:hypothetical protein